VLARWKFSGIDEGVYPEMYVEGKMTFDVSFGPGWPGHGASVLGLLTHAHGVINNLVLPPLEALH
jgi:hypothetical protein